MITDLAIINSECFAVGNKDIYQFKLCTSFGIGQQKFMSFVSWLYDTKLIIICVTFLKPKPGWAKGTVAAPLLSHGA